MRLLLLWTSSDAAPAATLLALASLATTRLRRCSALGSALFRRHAAAASTPIRNILRPSPTDAARRPSPASPPPFVVRHRFSSSGGSARVGMSADDAEERGGASASDEGDSSEATTAAAVGGGGRKSTTTAADAAKPKLIDVDCNLLHPDLVSLLLTPPPVPSSPPPSSDDPSAAAPEDDDDGKKKSPHPSLAILHHPSTSDAGITAVLSPSSTLDEAERGLDVLSSSTSDDRNGIEVLTTAGVHPYNVDDVPLSEDNVARLRSLLERWGGVAAGKRRGLIAAVGECGLDYSPGFPPRESQLPWFRVQLKAALEYDLPVFLHERLAFEDTLELIDEALQECGGGGKGDLRVIVHCFTGTRSEAYAYLERGYSISLSGYFLKDNADNSDEIRNLLREGIVPLDKLMIETDAPYLGFASCRDSFFEYSPEFATFNGKKRKKLLKGVYPNVPSALPMVLEGVTKYINEGREARGEALISRDEMARVTVQNACSFFGFSVPD